MVKGSDKMSNNKKIIILLIFVVSLLSFTTLFTISRYTFKKTFTDSIRTKELKIEFGTNGDTTVAKSHSSIVNITDTHSDNLTTLKYVWSSNNNADASEGTTFNDGDEITNNTLSGTYYLCIYAQDDKGFYDNVCSDAFYFDNTAPAINFTYNGNNTYKKSQSSTVTIVNDLFGADIDYDSLKYVWTKNTNVEPNESFNDGDELTKSTGSGEYYLIVKVCDTVGNCNTASSDVFKIDAEGPSAALNPSTGADVRTYINFAAEDTESGIVGYSITTTDTEPTTWIPVLDEVESTTEVKQEYGATWARIFHHNNRWGEVYFTNADEVKSSNILDKYSVLGNIDKYKQNGKFEFLLQYPDVSGVKYNRWTQTINPATTTVADGDGAATGYTAIHIDWSDSTWGGLAVSTTPGSTFIDGSVGINWWWYALGAYSAYNSAMPGPDTTHAATANLWVRIDGLTPVTKTNLNGRLGDLKDGKYYIWFKDSLGNVSRYEQNIERTYNLKIDANGGVYGDKCADENGTCTFSGTYEVCYGANSSFICKTVTDSIACNNTAFGSDPISGVAKACYVNKINNKIFKFSDVIDIKPPTRTGYLFTGWKELSGAAFSGNITNINTYKWSGDVTVTTQAKSSDNPLSTTTNEIKVTNSGSTSSQPGLGGFVQSKTVEEGHSYVHIIIAKLPVGYYFHNANNSLGDGATTEWLTSNAGTGKFQTYAYKVTPGTGTLADFGYVYVSTDPDNIWSVRHAETGSYTAYIAFSNIYDVTNIAGNTTNSPAGIGQLIGTSKLTATWQSNSFTVTCEDWFVDASNNRKVKLGSSTKAYQYGATASGADWGSDGTLSKYYTYYAYKSATSGTVPNNNNLVVYRYFHGWTNINIYYAGGSTEQGATVSFSNNGSSWSDIVNEVQADVTKPWGTTYYIKNIRPKNTYEEFDRVQNLTWNSAGYYTYTPTAAGTSMNIYMKYKNYTISYNLNGGSVSGNPTSYNYSTAAFTLKNPTRSGFTFTGWTGTGLSSASTSVTVATHSYGNRSYTANWRDSTNPGISLSVKQNTVSATITDNVGVVGYGVNQSSTTQPSYTSVTSATSRNISFTKTAGTYYLWVKDAAGNYTNKAFTIAGDVIIYNNGTRNYNYTTNLGSPGNSAISFNSNNISFNYYDNKTLYFTQAFANNYRYLKVSVISKKNNSLGTYNVSRLFVSANTTASNGMPSSIIAQLMIANGQSSADITSYTTKTLDLGSVNQSYYVAYSNCDSDVYINKIWLTNTP